jgi:D-alanine-D-alanine ligase
VTSGSDDRIRLLVLFGGQSAEHDVSCVTAAHVLNAVDPDRYDVETIGISRDGQFVHAGDAAELLAEARAAGPDLAPLSPAGQSVEPVASMMRYDGTDRQTVVLPLLHGPLGEDGTVQGLCELAGVPYVGAGVLGSAVAMDKVMAKRVLDQHGVPQTKWAGLHESDWQADPDRVVAELGQSLGYPCFVKPANMGSSIGVSKANSADDLRTAVDKALQYDEWLVVEEGVVAREIEISVLGNHDLEMSVPGEIVPGAEFYDYEDKYHDGNAQLIIPAELPESVVKQLYELAALAYRSLRVEGMARADFLYEEGGRGPLLNELNTIPGFTPISMYPKMWQASGLSYPDLIDRLVELAIERHRRREAKRVTTRESRNA